MLSFGIFIQRQFDIEIKKFNDFERFYFNQCASDLVITILIYFSKNGET